PPLAVKRAWDAKDERGAVPGEEAARRPHDRLVLEESVPEFDQRAGREADQDLRDREPKVEHGLAQDLEREQHGGHVKTGVADARKQDGILATADGDGSSFRRHGRVTRIQLDPLPKWIVMTAPAKLIQVL